jgi:hypothetical protein
MNNITAIAILTAIRLFGTLIEWGRRITNKPIQPSIP